FNNGPTSGGFQFFGQAESGKTTAAMVAGSIWGCYRGERRRMGFSESWNATANQIERVALAHNHTLVVLDETKLAGTSDRDRAETVRNVTFRLAEGVEKDRLTNVSGPRS